MADEAEGGEAAEVPAGGGSKSLIVSIIASAVTSAIVGAVFTFVLAPKPQALESEDSHEAETTSGHGAEAPSGHGSATSETGIVQAFDPFIVSIFDREKVHYLKVVLALELDSDLVKDEITLKNPQIRDAMIFVLSDFTLRELLDNQSKVMLKETMMKQINKFLAKGKVINIYLSEFTIQ